MTARRKGDERDEAPFNTQETYPICPPPASPRSEDDGSDKIKRVLSIFDENNQYSLVNLIMKKEHKFHEQLPLIDKELLQMDEADLKKVVNPSASDNRIRLAFWHEVDSAMLAGMKVWLNRVYAGLMTKETFVIRYISNHKRFAWMIRPLPTYESVLEEGTYEGLSQIRKILQAPLYDGRGKFLTTNARIVMQAAKIFQDRLHGGVVQRSIEHKTPSSPAMLPYTPEDLMELDSKIAQLENELLVENKGARQSAVRVIANQGEEDEQEKE